MKVWVVIFSNYEPSEVDSLWRTKESAEKRAEELGDMWDAVEWEVGE